MIRLQMIGGVHMQKRSSTTSMRQQGHPEGDVQDGHPDAPELLRRADFEAVGLDKAFVDSTSRDRLRAGGVGIDVTPTKWSPVIAQAIRCARRPARSPNGAVKHQWRRDGEVHLFNPETVFAATRDPQRSYAISAIHEARHFPEHAAGHAARIAAAAAGGRTDSDR
jgi:hypothetical protein